MAEHRDDHDQRCGLAPWLFNLNIDPKEQYPVVTG